MNAVRKTDSLTVLHGRIPVVPVSARIVEAMPIAEFDVADDSEGYAKRVENDDIIVLHFDWVTMVRIKGGNCAVRFRIQRPPEESPQN